MADKKYTASLIIVSYNAGRFLEKCLESIKQEALGNIEVIIVDNNSDEARTKEVLKEYSDRDGFRVVFNKTNAGFGRANNQAALLARGDWLIFVNSDTYWEKGRLKEFIKILEGQPKEAVAVGPRLVYPDGSLQYSMGFVPNWFNLSLWILLLDDLPMVKKIVPAYHINDKDKYSRVFHPGWLSGAFLAVKKEAFEKAGGFDKKIFMYGEDVVLGERLSRCGRLVYTPDVTIVHVGGASSSLLN
ncbi:MAG: glycosyltransferase family 2 protein, partial [bacterium]|nr:glycosyltransferase family 2 protein [bacterium]